MHAVHALPPAAYFLFLEAACGGALALLLIHRRGEVSPGYTLFTGWMLWISAILALWLRVAFPPSAGLDDIPVSAWWFAAERATTLGFILVLLAFLLALHAGRLSFASLLAPPAGLLALASLWAAAHVQASPQLAGLGAPLAVLAGAVALGSSVAGLSLGHWYLVAPSLSVRPLIQLTFGFLGAAAVQSGLVLAAFLPGAAPTASLLSEHLLFFTVRVLFGLVVPGAAAIMAWRTARIRSLDAATGLLYVVATLVLAGEIVARTLFFLTGVAL